MKHLNSKSINVDGSSMENILYFISEKLKLAFKFEGRTHRILLYIIKVWTTMRFWTPFRGWKNKQRRSRSAKSRFQKTSMKNAAKKINKYWSACINWSAWVPSCNCWRNKKKLSSMPSESRSRKSEWLNFRFLLCQNSKILNVLRKPNLWIWKLYELARLWIISYSFFFSRLPIIKNIPKTSQPEKNN